MPTTSNFGWNTPADTDLVKDGALAIRTLGNNIDTSLVDLKGGTTGQILSKNSNSDLDYTWINNDQGDITEVQAGTGISVASGTGPVPVVTNTVATAYDAKGDLVVGTGADTFAKLTSGSSGETLVADSTTTTGLRWQGDWNTGKNKIINGDFAINQRSFTSTTTNGIFGHDRWRLDAVGGTVTYSTEAFTPGAAPVAGYEGINFARLVSASQSTQSNYASIAQKIEDVRTLAGQTVTVSFWAKASTGTPNVGVNFYQNFGSGGSTTVVVTGSVLAITSSWVRYSATISVPSVSGKTIGAGSHLNLYLFSSAGTSVSASGYPAVGLQNVTIDFWGVQVEGGSVATPFTTATGTLQGELAACQRYYQRTTNTQIYGALGSGFFLNATDVRILVSLQTAMRIAPSSVDYGTVQLVDSSNTAFTVSALSLAANESSAQVAQVSVTTTGGTTHRFALLRTNNSTAGYIGFSAEL